MVPDQTADTEYSEGSKLYLPGGAMDAFSWPHCLMGRPAQRSGSLAPWQLSNQNNRPGAPSTELCQSASDIGFELLADHKWSFSTKLIKSWLQF